MNILKYEGTWINSVDQKSIRLTGPNTSDEYILESDYEKNEFRSQENIEIFKTNAVHARLPESDRFTGKDIIIIDADKFQIGNEVFAGVKNKHSSSTVILGL